jgi:hypothetical protein
MRDNIYITIQKIKTNNNGFTIRYGKPVLNNNLYKKLFYIIMIIIIIYYYKK